MWWRWWWHGLCSARARLWCLNGSLRVASQGNRNLKRRQLLLLLTQGFSSLISLVQALDLLREFLPPTGVLRIQKQMEQVAAPSQEAVEIERQLADKVEWLKKKRLEEQQHMADLSKAEHRLQKVRGQISVGEREEHELRRLVSKHARRVPGAGVGVSNGGALLYGAFRGFSDPPRCWSGLLAISLRRWCWRSLIWIRATRRGEILFFAVPLCESWSEVAFFLAASDCEPEPWIWCFVSGCYSSARHALSKCEPWCEAAFFLVASLFEPWSKGWVGSWSHIGKWSFWSPSVCEPWSKG